MLEIKRIKEAETNVKSYLDQGLLKKTNPDKNIISIFVKNGKESLRVADDTFNSKISDLWVIVCSYYSMFYYANAVLLKNNIKVGDKIVHKVTSDAIIIYIRKRLKESLIEDFEIAKEEAMNLAGIKADSLIEAFDYEREKRNLIQYQTKEIEKYSKAKTSLQRAKEFSKEMEKLLL